MKPKLSYRKKLFFSFVAVVFFFLLLETVPRCFLHIGVARFVDGSGAKMVLRDHGLGFPRPTPNLRGHMISGEFNAVICTDEEGIRVSPELQGLVSPPDADLDLICVGDSVTFGNGVNYESTFSWQLWERLRQSLDAAGYSAKRIRLVNLGCPGTGTHSQRLRLEHYLESRSNARPTLVVWTLLVTDGFSGGNDLIDTLNSVGDETAGGTADPNASRYLTREARRDETPRPLAYRLKQSLSRQSVTYELVMRTLGRRIRASVPREPTEAQRKQLDDAWVLLGEQLRLASQAASLHNCRLVLGYYPYMHEAAGENTCTLEKLRPFIPSNATFVSLLPTLHQHRKDYSFPRDGHPNERGHDLVAEAYAKEVLPVVMTMLCDDPRQWEAE